MKKRKIILIIGFLLIPIFHFTGERAFAGQSGAQGGDPADGCQRPQSAGCSEPTPTPTPKPNNAQEQKQFAAAQTRNERDQPPGAGTLRGGDSATRSNFSFFMSILVLLGGIWALIALLRQSFGGKPHQQTHAPLPKICGFGLKLWRENLIMKPKILLFVTLIFLIAPIFLIEPAQKTLAGQIGTQTGAPVTPTPRTEGLYQQQEEKRDQKQLAAAQFRNAQNPPPGGGLNGGDSEIRSNLSFYLSILVLLGGIWALIALLRQRLANNSMKSRGRLPVNWNLAFKPQFALSVFGFLFAAAIIGGTLTAPTGVTAEKRDKRDKSKMTGLMNPSSKPVFKTAQAIGGGGTTQIGAPVFDSAGNRYVRGGFTGDVDGLRASRFFDAFVAKYDSNGNALWARQATGAIGGISAANSIEGATALGVDPSGNVYIGGSFVKTITLEGGTSITLTDGATGADAGKVNYESFVAKYDANGNLLWARGGNTNSPKNADNLETGQNGIDQIVFDGNGNPYLTGFVSGTNFLGSTTTNAGQSDIVLARLNPLTGAVVWKQIIGGTNDDNGLDLKNDAAGNLYIIGNFGSATITFPTSPATTFTNTDDSTATFIAKFDSSGANLWAKELDNASIVGGSQIAVSAAGEIFLTGYFIDSATFGNTTLFETEGGGTDEESLGGYLAQMNSGGDFVWAKGFGGLGEALALDGAGRVYVVGTFYDGGTFGVDTPNKESLASFGGEDLFVARYDSSGNFDWAKPIAGSGVEGTSVIDNPDSNAGTENNYNALGIAYNPARGTMFVSGDFQRAIALDCITLTTPGNIQSYVAEISPDSETTSCRIWNGLDEDDNDFDSIDNWNGGVLPSAGDSVYVPYTGNNFDAPDYNPSRDIPLGNLTVADDRILTLGRNLTVNNRLDLLGGFVDAENFTLLLGAAAQSFSINDGLVLGRVQKLFAAGSARAFTFPVGTASSEGFPEYSPVTLSNISGTGSFSVIANKGAYPHTASGLPANRANRWWNLTNNDLTKADLTFKYVDGDIINGTENNYRAYRIPTGGGEATQVNSTIDTTTKTVTAPAVAQFSDWTLAQPLASTAASVSVGGRVTDGDGRGILGASVWLTDASGQMRTARTDFLGFYRFEDVAVGQIYTFTVRAKRRQFAPQVVSVTEQIDDLSFAAQ